MPRTSWKSPIPRWPSVWPPSSTPCGPPTPPFIPFSDFRVIRRPYRTASVIHQEGHQSAPCHLEPDDKEQFDEGIEGTGGKADTLRGRPRTDHLRRRLRLRGHAERERERPERR